MNTNPFDHKPLAGDDKVLIGAARIQAFLIKIGWPETTDVYHLKRSGWPIGKTAGDNGQLIATERRLLAHSQKLASQKKTNAA